MTEFIAFPTLKYSETPKRELTEADKELQSKSDYQGYLVYGLKEEVI
ncbi:hypothetical protein [Spirochaeta cellobiosiphila]|nr:hypothetical protein [Spirochaeta cellobiosiphila]